MVSMIIILFLVAVLVSLFAGRLAEVIAARMRGGGLGAHTADRPGGKP